MSNLLIKTWDVEHELDILNKDDFKERKVLTTRKDGVVTIKIDDRLGLQVEV